MSSLTWAVMLCMCGLLMASQQFLLMGLVFWTVLVLKNSEKELKALETSSPRRRQRHKNSGAEDEKP